MESHLAVFDYQDKQVRVIQDEQGEPWFVAKDLAEVLGYKWNPYLLNHIPEQWKGSKPIVTLGGVQEMIVLSEQGIYFFLGRSDKPAALPFQMFLAGEVMPSIRKHGAYMTPETIERVLDDPDTIIILATKLKEERQARKALEAERKALLPKAEFFDAVTDSKDAIDIGSAAKVLNCGFGRTTLFQFLREKGVLMPNNAPYQIYIDRGYFRVIEQKYAKPDGSTHIYLKTIVYQSGLNYIRRIINNSKKKAA